MRNQSRCGFITLLGRPNVGKSTLLNTLLGTKVSITSKKPQTTRNRVLGIKTEGPNQAIFVDTPGIHLHPKREINRMMIKQALTAIEGVDVIVFLIDARQWTEEDALVLSKLKGVKIPVVVVLNKIDKIKNKEDLLPLFKRIDDKLQEAKVKQYEIIPVSAKTGKNLADLEQAIYDRLPKNPHYFPDDQITDRGSRFMAAELIREKILRLFGEEVPHEVAVSIEEFKELPDIDHVHATIWVERSGQKKIIIGSGGAALKEIGTLARKEMEKLFEKKIFLRLWVKVKSGWMDNERALLSLGYFEDNSK